MEGFEKEKSIGPDGWIVEFFLEFFDTMGVDLLAIMEESRVLVKVNGALNATFLTLIPKKDRPGIFKYFRPIALCNLVYEVISKIIANIIKHVLSKFMTKEKFGFLEDRKIMDVIGVAQEGLHSIKTKKLKSLVLKLDLVEAYDRVSCDFLRLVLLEIGLSLEATKWIMGCVSSANFFSFGDWRSYSNFRSSRGLRWGCPMSPLLFLLIVEGLSRLITRLALKGNPRN